MARFILERSWDVTDIDSEYDSAEEATAAAKAALEERNDDGELSDDDSVTIFKEVATVTSKPSKLSFEVEAVS